MFLYYPSKLRMNPKGGLLPSKRPSFAGRKTAYWKGVGNQILISLLPTRLERAVKTPLFSRPDVSFTPFKRLVWTAFSLLCFYV